MSMQAELQSWAQTIMKTHLPRWEELPDMDLYKDQVVTLVEKHLGPLFPKDEKIITPSMINNYVKWKMMPAPNKKKQYNRDHFGYLLAITCLKRVMEIKTVKEGIFLQEDFEGPQQAYNTFCEQMELALQETTRRLLSNQEVVPLEPVPEELIMVRMACTSFASKLISNKIVELNAPQEEIKEGKKK